MRSNLYKIAISICLIILMGGLNAVYSQYCTSNLYIYGCQYGDYIDNVSIAGFNQTSTFCAGGSTGYSDYTSSMVSMEQGSPYSLTVTTGNYGQYVSMWIDLNDNETFEPSEKLVSYLYCNNPNVNYIANFILPVTAIPGDHRMRVRSASYTFPLDPCLQYNYGEVHDYTAHIIPPSNMSYVSSTTTQTNFNTTSLGTPDVEVIGIQIVTSGSLNPQSVTSFTLNSNGTTNFASDVSNVKIYYTGNNGIFSTSDLFGSSTNLSSPITGNQLLSQGTNYFWVAYDISTSAAAGDLIDAECTQIVLSGAGAQTPSVTAPPGSKQVNFCLPTNTFGCYFAYIDDVILNTLSNVDNFCNGSTDGYVFYAPTGSLTTTLQIGSNYAITLDGSPTEPVGFGVWIDFNNDFDFDDPDEFLFSSSNYVPGTQYGSITIPNNSAYIGTHRMRVRAKDYGIVTAGESCTTFSYGEAEDYEITVSTSTNMVYLSSTVTQDLTATATPGTPAVKVIGIEVVTQGSLSPFDVTKLTLNSNGSTDFANDVSQVNVYYTGITPVFSTSTLFGSATNLSSPVTGNVTLQSGTNYFWVAYDLSSDAGIGNFLDGECTKIVMTGAGGTQNPTVSAPAGNIEINYCIPTTTYGCNFAYIDDVIFNTLSNVNTGCNFSAGGYTNYAPAGSLTTSVEVGGTYTITLESGPALDDVAFGVWIDYNNDGDFDDLDEYVFSSPNAIPGVQTGTITIPNNPIYYGEHRMRIRSKEYGTIFSTESCNLFLYYYGESEDYTITITAPGPMSYASSTTVQNNTDPVSLGATDIEILGIQISTIGSQSPFSVTSLTVNSNGCTDYFGDVTNAKIYYTGTDPFFNTSNLFGSSTDLASPVTGNQVLAEGTNYFWVAFDLSATGSLGNFLDAECSQITMTNPGGTQVPTVIAPVGYRVLDYCIPNNIYGCYSAYIDGVQLNNLTNTFTYCNGSANGYIQYAPSGSLTTTVAQGETYDLTLTGPNYTSVGFGVWIDYNSDGDFDDNDEFVYSSPFAITGIQYGIVTIASDPSYVGDRRMRIRTKDYALVSATESCMDFLNGEAEDYTITITPAVTSMSYVSSTTTQNNLDNINLGEQDAEILGIQVVTSGALDPFAVTSFTLNSTGSSSFASDVSNVQIYYTGNSSTFSTGTLFGTATDLSLPITGNQILGSGINHFWVAYDISSGATLGDYVDAQCTQIVMDAPGGTQTPTVTSPFGARLINTCIPTYGTLCSSGDYIDICVLNTLSNYYSGCNGNLNNYIFYDPGTFTTEVDAGASYSVTLQSGPTYGQGFGIWIDFNNNADFGDPGEFVYASPSYGTSPFTGTITLPVDPAYYGNRLMRVRCAYATTLTAIDYCTSNFYFGEIEDYIITINAPAPCTGTPVAGIVSADPPVLCSPGNPSTLTVSGYTPADGITFQWESSPDGSSWSGISGATATTYTATIASPTYFRVTATCTNTGQSSSSPSLQVKLGGNEEITSVTDATICGLGNVDLQATSNSDYVLWYESATGGSPLYYSSSPSTFSSFISNTTTYYASSATGYVNIQNVGAVDNSIGITNQYITWAFQYFDVYESCTLEGVYVYPAAPGNVIIQWTDQNYNVIQTASMAVTVDDVNQKTYMPLNFHLTPGTNYHLAWIGGSVNLYSNDYNYNGYGYPYQIPGVMSITQSSYGFFYYLYFYDWKINYSQLCESPVREPVVGTVTPAPALTLTSDPSNGVICTGAAQPVDLIASGPYSTYTWSPADGLSSTSGASVSANPVSSTTYIVSASDGTCNNADTVTVSVVQSPLLTVTASPDGVCTGGSTQLNASSPAVNYSVSQITYAPDAGSGTIVPLNDNQLSGALPIGFTFNFYGNNYTSFHISDNGFITFDPFSGSGCCSGQFLPNTSYPNNLIAFAWEDLNPASGGTISYYTTGTLPYRKMVMEFDGVPHYPNGDAVTAQVILYESTNIIEIHTGSMPGNSSGFWDFHTEGIEDAYGTSGLTVPGRNFDATWTATNDAWRFSPSQFTYSWVPANSLSDPDISGPVASPSLTTTYTVTVTDITTLCSSTGNATVNLLTTPETGVIVTSGSDFCSSGSATLTLEEYTPGATINWASSLTSGGPYSNIAGATSDSYTTPTLTSTTYYVANVKCANQATTPEQPITINTPPNVPVGINGGHCGPGTVILNATGSGIGSLNWFYSEFGNTYLGSGSPFTTPYIVQTTDFWVEEGLPSPAPLPTNYFGFNSQNGSMFDITAINDVFITSFDVNLGFGSSDFEIYYKAGSFAGSETTPSNWTLVATASGVASNGPGIATPIPANLSIFIPAGETYGFYITSSNYNYLYYENGTSVGTVIASDGNLQVKEGASNYYPFGYPSGITTRWNGTVHYFSTGCSSPRIPVTAEIYSPQVAALATDNVICQGESIDLIAENFTPGNFVYEWSPAIPGMNPQSGLDDTVSVSPPVTMTFTVSVSDPSAGCDTAVSVIITVNPTPAVFISGLAPQYYDNDPPVPLVGIPAGGTFSGPGVSGNTFIPGSVGIGGPYTITYTFTDVNGCTGSTSQDVYVVAIEGIAGISNIISLDIYPNPTDGLTTLDLKLSDPEQHVVVRLFNVIGQAVYENNLGVVTGEIKQALDLNQHSAGTYYLQLAIDDKMLYRKLTIQR